MKGPVADYFDRAIATFDGDPPASEFQRGHLEALKVARAELATKLTSSDLAVRLAKAAQDICGSPLEEAAPVAALLSEAADALGFQGFGA